MGEEMGTGNKSDGVILAASSVVVQPLIPKLGKNSSITRSIPALSSSNFLLNPKKYEQIIELIKLSRSFW